MTEITEVPGSRGGQLKAAPILVYPHSAEQRDMLKKAAKLEGRNMSNFMVYVAMEFIAKPKATITPTLPDGNRAKTIMVYPWSPEQRDSFQEAADAQGMNLSPFMVFCALQFIANKK